MNSVIVKPYNLEPYDDKYSLRNNFDENFDLLMKYIKPIGLDNLLIQTTDINKKYLDTNIQLILRENNTMIRLGSIQTGSIDEYKGNIDENKKSYEKNVTIILKSVDNYKNFLNDNPTPNTTTNQKNQSLFNNIIYSLQQLHSDLSDLRSWANKYIKSDSDIRKSYNKEYNPTFPYIRETIPGTATITDDIVSEKQDAKEIDELPGNIPIDTVPTTSEQQNLTPNDLKKYGKYTYVNSFKTLDDSIKTQIIENAVRKTVQAIKDRMNQKNTYEYQKRKEDYANGDFGEIENLNYVFRRKAFRLVNNYVDELSQRMTPFFKKTKNYFFPKVQPAYMNSYNNITPDDKNFFLKYKWNKVITLDEFQHFFPNNDFTQPNEENINKIIEIELIDELLNDTEQIFEILNQGSPHPILLRSSCSNISYIIGIFQKKFNRCSFINKASVYMYKTYVISLIKEYQHFDTENLIAEEPSFDNIITLEIMKNSNLSNLTPNKKYEKYGVNNVYLGKLTKKVRDLKSLLITVKENFVPIFITRDITVAIVGFFPIIFLSVYVTLTTAIVAAAGEFLWCIVTNVLTITMGKNDITEEINKETIEDIYAKNDITEEINKETIENIYAKNDITEEINIETIEDIYAKNHFIINGISFQPLGLYFKNEIIPNTTENRKRLRQKIVDLFNKYNDELKNKLKLVKDKTGIKIDGNKLHLNFDFNSTFDHSLSINLRIRSKILDKAKDYRTELWMNRDSDKYFIEMFRLLISLDIKVEALKKELDKYTQTSTIGGKSKTRKYKNRRIRKTTKPDQKKRKTRKSRKHNLRKTRKMN